MAEDATEERQQFWHRNWHRTARDQAIKGGTGGLLLSQKS